jgi:hypothetical protein
MRRFHRVQVAVLVLGMLHTGFLLGQLPREGFYTTDGKLKHLLVQQFARGEITPALRLTDEAWVESLWDKGLYPLRPPFVYETPRGRLVSFPLLFELISTPFYRLFGGLGLHVIPAAALWLLWIRFALTMRRLDLGTGPALAALIVLVFASPLSLYGAVFSEHTLGALLVFVGVEYVLLANRRRYSAPVAAALGLLVGLAPWFRSETLVMSAAFFLAAGWLRFRRGVRSATAFGIGVGLGAALLLVFNLLFYGHAFGLHGLQVLAFATLHRRIDRASTILPDLVVELVHFFPVFLAAVVGLRIGRTAARFRRTEFATVVVLAAVCLLAVPILAPNTGGKQWGPRYLFALIPLTCILMALLLDVVRARGPRWARRAVVLAFAVTALAGVWMNAVLGTRHLVEDARTRVRTLPSYMRDYPCLAIARHVVAHAYLGSYENRIFRIRDQRTFAALVSALEKRGVDRFLFLLPRDDHDRYLELSGPKRARRVELVRIGPPGAFGCFEARILPE